MVRVVLGVIGLVLAAVSVSAAQPAPAAPRTIDLGKHGNIWVTRLALSPDGAVLAVSGSEDIGKRLLSLWSAATGRHLRTIRDTTWIAGFDFSPDGKTIAVPSEKDGAVVLYDTAAAKELRRFPHRAVRFAQFAPSGRHLVTSSWEEEDDADDICVWDVASGKRVYAANWNGYGGIDHPRFTPDGRLMFWSANHDLRCWDPATGKERPAVAIGRGPDWRFELSPAGTKVLGDNSGRLRLYNPETGAVTNEFGRKQDFINHIAFTPDDRWLVISRDAGPIEVWDVIKGTRLSRFDGPAPTGIARPYAEPLSDGRHVFARRDIWTSSGTLAFDKAALYTNVGKLVRQLPDVREIAFDRAGRTVAVYRFTVGDATRPSTFHVTIHDAAAWLAAGAKKE